MIDYKMLAEALHYYENLGYIYKDVEWAVYPEYTSITKPKECKEFKFRDKVLVGSAEQSFIALYDDLEFDTTYMAITPCFRDEIENNRFVKDYFIKLELFVKTKDKQDLFFDRLKSDCFHFYNSYMECQFNKQSDKVIDIESFEGIEVASICKNNYSYMSWVCATGIALPRFSEALKGVNYEKS